MLCDFVVVKLIYFPSSSLPHFFFECIAMPVKSGFPILCKFTSWCQMSSHFVFEKKMWFDFWFLLFEFNLFSCIALKVYYIILKFERHRFSNLPVNKCCCHFLSSSSVRLLAISSLSLFCSPCKTEEIKKETKTNIRLKEKVHKKNGRNQNNIDK